MTIIQKLHARNIIAKIAKQQGISVSQCLCEMDTAILAAWSTTDPVARQHQVELVGDSHIPTPEELIFLISSKIT